MHSFAHGGDIYTQCVEYDFSVNTNPFGIPETVYQKLFQEKSCFDRYPDPDCRSLCRKLSEVYDINASNIICSNGTTEMIYSVVRACHQGRAVIIEPTFSEYERALTLCEFDIYHYETKAENQFSLNEKILEIIESEKPELLFLCNPNNPTGRLTEDRLLYQILVKSAETGTRLVVDESFIEFVPDDKKHTLIKYIDEFPNLFLLRGFTKIFSMAGLRLGYGICSDLEFLKRCRRQMPFWNVSGPAQFAGQEVLKGIDLIGQQTYRILLEKERMIKELNRLGFKVINSDSCFICFFTKLPLKEMLLKEKVLIRDCSNFYGMEMGYYRIAVKTADQNSQLITILERIL